MQQMQFQFSLEKCTSASQLPGTWYEFMYSLVKQRGLLVWFCNSHTKSQYTTDFREIGRIYYFFIILSRATLYAVVSAAARLVGAA